MENYLCEAEQLQPSFQTSSSPSNPATPPLESKPAPYLHYVKSEEDDDYLNSFPAGYKFIPDDDELIVEYLNKKIENSPLPRNKIVDVKLYEHNPKDLAEKFEHYGNKVKEKKWYFFTPRDRKYKNGSRPNRAAGNGYWKATGADKKVRYNGEIVGYRKSLVFYVGKPPKGQKTNWIMHEFRVADPPKPKINGAHDMKLDDWVLCSIHEKLERPSKKRRQDSDCNVEDDSENGDDSDNNLVVDNLMQPPPQDDAQPSFPETYNHRSYMNPISPNSSFNPLIPFYNFSSNQFVEDIDNQLDYGNVNCGQSGSHGGNSIMLNTALTPIQNFKPTFETSLQSLIFVPDELTCGGRFDELNTSSLKNRPVSSVPGVLASSYTSSENAQPQPVGIVENYNSLAQLINVSPCFDTSDAQLPVDTDESSVENFKITEE